MTELFFMVVGFAWGFICRRPIDDWVQKQKKESRRFNDLEMRVDAIAMDVRTLANCMRKPE
jgi:hypothetical protein